MIIWEGSFPGAPLDGAVIVSFGVAAVLVAVSARLPQQPVEAGYRTFKPYPGTCPSAVGSFTIEKCHTFRGGWLLVESTNPVSDQAGFYYRPGLSRVDDPDAGLTHVDGDWYSWRQEPMN